MRPSTTLLALLSAAALSAQIGRRELITDSGTVVLHYHKSGQVSTKEWRDKADRFGRSWAYKRDGSVIFEGGTRRIGGHASVHFSYHPNGAVSKVETSDMPDGGIQWYRSTTTFDAEGNRTGFWEDGRDNYGPIQRPGAPVRHEPMDPHDPRLVGQPGHVEPTLPPHPPGQEVAACQRMFQNELFVVNPTRSAVRVVATPKDPSPAMPGGTWTMVPGDTIRIGSYSQGEAWPAWKEVVDLGIVRVASGDRNRAVARIRTDERFLTEAHRQLHVVIEGWSTAKPPGAKDDRPGEPSTPGTNGAAKPEKKRWWRFHIGGVRIKG